MGRPDSLVHRTFLSLAPLQAVDLARWYLVLALVGVLPLILLTPPLQVPDEQQHFFRAYQVSEGTILASVRDHIPGGDLPSSLAEFSDRFIGSHRFLPTAENFRTHYEPLRLTLGARDAPLDPGRREFVEFFGAASYSPLGYLPQAAGILVGRAFGAGPLVLLYLARLANGLAAIVAVTAALRILPLGGMLALAAALMPMAIYMFASASPDASVISMAFLFTAVAMRARFRGRWTARDLIVAGVAGAVFCSVKPFYLPLLAMALPASFKGRIDVRFLAGQVALMVIVFGVTALWLTATSATIAPFREGRVDLTLAAPQGINSSLQLAGILAHPGPYVMTVLRTVKYNGMHWSRNMIGLLGWANIRLFMIMYPIGQLAALACAILPRARGPRIGAAEAAFQAVLIGACGVLALTAIYLTFTPVGLNEIVGVQGRYFIPLAPLAAVTLDGVLPHFPVTLPTAAQVALPLLAVNILLTLVLVADYFSVF